MILNPRKREARAEPKHHHWHKSTVVSHITGKLSVHGCLLSRLPWRSGSVSRLNQCSFESIPKTYKNWFKWQKTNMPKNMSQIKVYNPETHLIVSVLGGDSLTVLSLSWSWELWERREKQCETQAPGRKWASLDMRSSSASLGDLGLIAEGPR